MENNITELIKKLKHVYLAILVGGKGERLYPLSNRERPKPNCPITSHQDEDNWADSTLLLKTISNFLKIGFSKNNIILVTATDQQTELFNQEVAIPMGIYSEMIWQIPPEYGYAGTMVEVTRMLSVIDREAVLFVTPADHYLTPDYDFAKAIFRLASSVGNGHIAAIGMKKNDLETVMNCGNFVYSRNLMSDNIVPVYQFIEKPDEELAIELINSGSSIVNTGICAWRAKDLLRHVRRSEGLGTEELMNGFNGNLRVVVGDFPWYDCGTLKGLYAALHDSGKCDKKQNAMIGYGGHIVGDNTEGNLICVDEGMFVDVNGAKDVAVVFTKIEGRPTLLVSDINETQRIRQLAENYDEHRIILTGDFASDARNNIVLKSKMYYQSRFIFVGVEGYRVGVYLKDKKHLVAKVRKAKA